ncbi:MAG: glycosyltransferase [Chloroflexota bacterium]
MTTPQQPKRIVRIVAHLDISGPALQAILLTSALQDLAYDSTLIGFAEADSKDNLTALAHSYDIQPMIVPELGYTRPLGSLSAIRRLTQILRDIKPDIVHTHNTRAGYVGRIAARLAGVPVVVHTLHEYPFDGYYNRLSTIIFIYTERFGANLSDSIITLSQSLRQKLVETYGITRRSRITVLPMGYDLHTFAESNRHQGDFRKAWNIASDAPLIGIIGRLLPVKNHRLFLQMASQVLVHQSNACFAIIGDGEERKFLEAYAEELGIASQVIFTGWQQNLEHIYSDLDVLVNSSLNEGTPVPIIEALSTQCPVVATDVGGVADLLDNGRYGSLISSGNVAQLTEAVLDVLQSQPDMQSAQATMLRRYGIDRLAQDLDSLYRGLYLKTQSSG